MHGHGGAAHGDGQHIGLGGGGAAQQLGAHVGAHCWAQPPPHIICRLTTKIKQYNGIMQ